MPSEQRNLFDTEPEPWEADDQPEQFVAGVVLASGPPQEFDYLVPEPLRDQVEPRPPRAGSAGQRQSAGGGYCVRVGSRVAGPRPLKPLSEVIDRRSLLSPAMLRLTRWIGEYYLCPWGQVLETVLPAGVRGQAGTRMATLLDVGRAAARSGWPRAICPTSTARSSRLGRSRRTAHAAGIGPGRELFARPDRHAPPQGFDPCRNGSGFHEPAGGSRVAAR